MPPKHCTQEQSHSECPHPVWCEIRIDHHRQPDRQRLPVFHLPPIPKGTKTNQTEENAKDNIVGFKFKHDSFEGIYATSESPQHEEPFLPLIDPVHHSSISDPNSMLSKLFLVPTATILLPPNCHARNHAQADAALKMNPISVVDKKLTPPSGDKHGHPSLALVSGTTSRIPTAKPTSDPTPKNGPPTL